MTVKILSGMKNHHKSTKPETSLSSLYACTQIS